MSILDIVLRKKKKANVVTNAPANDKQDDAKTTLSFPDRTQEKTEYSTAVFLKWLNGYPQRVPTSVEDYPKYFTNPLCVVNPVALFHELISNGCLRQATISEVLNTKTVTDLKVILSDNGIVAKERKKQDIINRIKNEIQPEKLSLPKMYMVTEKGLAFMSQKGVFPETPLADCLSEYTFICINDSFTLALQALECHDFVGAERIIKAYYENNRTNNMSKTENYVRGITPHFHEVAYIRFFEHKIDWPETLSLSDGEMKRLMILYTLYGLRTETAVRHLKSRKGISVDFGLVHKAKRILQSHDAIISGRDAATAIHKGNSEFKVFYTIKTMRDGAVCEYCKNMEGKKLSYDDAIIGVNYPPFDKCKSDYCRCMALQKME